MREVKGKGLTIRPIRTMMNHATTEVFFENMRVPAENLIGDEGEGFRYILSGMNAERILIAAECIGDAKWFIDKATAYAGERVVFGRPIGQNQGVQFPIARAYIAMRAAELMVREAAALYEAGKDCGAEANMAKHLAAEASWAAADMCVQTHGGFGFAEEFDIERKFRETRLYTVAPISTNLVLSYVAEHVLGLPQVVFEHAALPLSGLLVVSLEQAVAAPMCTCRLADAGARVIKIERPEGDFARGYDDAGARRVQLFRLAQPRQGIGRARSRQGRRQGAARRDARARRRVRAEPQARRGGKARLPDRATAPRASAADLLLDLRLRRERAATPCARPTTC